MESYKEIDNLIDLALAEDIRSGDITTLALIPEKAIISANLSLKQAGVVAGLPFIERFFHKVDPLIKVELCCKEGAFLKSGTVIALITGPAQGIFTAERAVLNFLQHCSGVATTTAAFVKKVAGLNCAIMDTRKTLPGLRAIEKYAVKVAGGKNHRFGLDDRLVIKRNHISFLNASSPHAFNEAFEKVKAKSGDLPIEIEIDDITLLDRALKTDVFAITLSNMTPEDITKCVRKIRKTNKKVYIESAGIISLETVRAYAETGIDGISIGDLTHSVKALDIKLRLI
ncbi:MAG: carboxylating nicotinate-nucleotide diphosphorylase [Parachlamydiaceae bacterium]|nr:carboxylating nicotinate-nucleotide diphosphorylase [Parachlamydiaceae bacterium]